MPLADLLGTLLWALILTRRRIVRVNLTIAFPEQTPAARRRLERAHFRSATRGLFEGGVAWWLSDRRIAGRYALYGLEHLEEARRRGRGVILLAAHYTSVEMGTKILGRHIEAFYPVYKPAKDRLFDAEMLRVRRAAVTGMLHNEDMRGILRVLRSNGVVWYAPDQDFGSRSGVFAPFMGAPAMTLTMTGRLAQASGAAVVPVRYERRPGPFWHVEMLPALADFPSGDEVTDAARVNALIEEQVERAPEQYLWLHRRFKTRPDPDARSPYSSG